jgi:hypothetical protein
MGQVLRMFFHLECLATCSLWWCDLGIHSQINNQRLAIRCEFEPVGPTLLKNPLDARWGSTTYLVVGEQLASYLPNFFFPSSREKNVHNENRMFMHTCKNSFLMWTSLVSCFESRVHSRQRRDLNIGVTFGKSCNDEYLTILVTP